MFWKIKKKLKIKNNEDICCNFPLRHKFQANSHLEKINVKLT